MPIYEFKCEKCQDVFELLVKPGVEKEVEMKCPSCGGDELERVLSVTNYAMTGGSGGNKSAVSAQTRNCSGGSCTTYDIPGPK